MSQPETANSKWEISLKSSLLFKKKIMENLIFLYMVFFFISV